MIKARIRWCRQIVKSVVPFLLHSILYISQTSYRTFKIISSYELARPIMGTIFLVIIILFRIMIKISRIAIVMPFTCKHIATVEYSGTKLVLINSSLYLSKFNK